MTELQFLSPLRCPEEAVVSPLRRALEFADPTVVRDLGLDGIVELRGDLGLLQPEPGEQLLRLTRRRGFLFTDDDPADAAERARAQGLLAYDATGALSGMAIAGERLLRRLTDLDLDRLPAAGPFAEVFALVLRDEDERFRVYVPQELGHYAAEAVLDAAAGLEALA